jgi:hypothetical protein
LSGGYSEVLVTARVHLAFLYRPPVGGRRAELVG